MKKLLRAACATLLGATLSAAQAQTPAPTITLKVHHFLPAGSYAHQMFIKPWCDKIAADSNQRLVCQIYPSMQLGGAPAQLVEQVRDGVVDVVWTLPGYTAGRFPSVEVFELPFMMQNPEATSRAVWDFVQQHAAAEFKDLKPLAFHVHGDGVFHMVNKPIRTAADLKGLKVRAPTRQTNRFLAALGATPVAMPVPQVGEALAKGVIDGAVVPYEVVPSVKIQEFVKFHSETDPGEPAFYTSVFMFVMNKARYDALPADLKQVVDASSGQDLSGRIGRTFLFADGQGKKLVTSTRNQINVIPKEELDQWRRLGQPIIDTWVSEVGAKGANGRALLEAARQLIATHGARKP